MENTKCPCCGRPAKIVLKPGIWEGQKDQVIVKHNIWAENYQ